MRSNTLSRRPDLALHWFIAVLAWCLVSFSAAADSAAADNVEAASDEVAEDETQVIEVSVKVRGIKDELRDNAKAFLTIRQKTRKQDTAQVTASDVEKWHSLADAEIRQALQPFGYYNVLIDAQLEQESEYKWKARYEVTKGIRSRWRSIEVEVPGLPEELDELRSQALPSLDSYVDHQKYAGYKSAWLARLLDAGYLDARFTTSRFVVDVANNACLLYTSPSPRDQRGSRMPSSA